MGRRRAGAAPGLAPYDRRRGFRRECQASGDALITAADPLWTLGEAKYLAKLDASAETPEAARVSKTMIAAILLMCSTLDGCQSGAASDCLSGRREALTTGGFSGLLECSGEDVTLNFVGTTETGYTIYDYRYRAVAAAVMHGGQRLVIFRGSTYVGQYALSPPPYSTAVVLGSDIHVRGDEPSSEEAVLNFSNGVPSHAFLAGHVVDLYR